MVTNGQNSNCYTSYLQLLLRYETFSKIALLIRFRIIYKYKFQITNNFDKLKFFKISTGNYTIFYTCSLYIYIYINHYKVYKN